MTTADDRNKAAAGLPDIARCIGKHTFPSRELAERARSRKTASKKRPNRYSYRCGLCQLWHLAGRTQTSRTERRASVNRRRELERYRTEC